MPNKLPFIWGESRVDTSQLYKLENIQQKIVQLIGSIEEVVIEFTSNSSELVINDLKSISSLIEDIEDLKAYSEKAGRIFKLGILGFSDTTGTLSANNDISEQRTRIVHEELVNQGIAEEDLLAKGFGRVANKSEINRNLNCISQRCVIIEVYLD